MEEKKAKSKLAELSEQVEELASKAFESLKERIEKALASRNVVLSVRVSEETSRKLDMLVEAGLFKSRSECAAFLIEEGIKRNEEMLKKIEEKIVQIEKLRKELQEMLRS